jgi:hypothetical protein
MGDFLKMLVKVLYEGFRLGFIYFGKFSWYLLKKIAERIFLWIFTLILLGNTYYISIAPYPPSKIIIGLSIYAALIGIVILIDYIEKRLEKKKESESVEKV